MTITVGTTGNGSGGSSLSATVDSGSNRIFVAFAGQSRNPPNLADSATLGGVAATGTLFYETATGAPTSQVAIAGWYWDESALSSIGTGAKTLQLTGSSTSNRISYLNASGVLQAAPESASSNIEASNSTTHTSTCSPVSSGSLLVFFLGYTTNGITAYDTGVAIYPPTTSGTGASYRLDGTTLTATSAQTLALTTGSASFKEASGVTDYTLTVNAPAACTPSTQSVGLTLVGSFSYTLSVDTPAVVTPTTGEVSFLEEVVVGYAHAEPVTFNVGTAVTLPVSAAQLSPETQNVSLIFSGVATNYTVSVVAASLGVAMQDVSLNAGFPSTGSAPSQGRRNRRTSYSNRFTSRG